MWETVLLFSVFLGISLIRKYFMGENNQVRILESPQYAANFCTVLTLQIVAALLSSWCLQTHCKNTIYLFMDMLGLCCCTCAFSSCSERGATLHCGAQASHCGGFCCRAGAPGTQAPVAAACSLRNCGMQALGCMGFCSCDTGAR